MNLFKKRAAMRIAAISALLACIASPVSWFIARESAEEGIVSLAIEESDGLLRHFNVFGLSKPASTEQAEMAAKTISGGLFDVAEIYDGTGAKLAASTNRDGDAVEPWLPKHPAPSYSAASYKSLNLPDGHWVLRVFVPLRALEGDTSGPITGYFEGIRIVPPWQREQIWLSSLISALIAGLASLLCGAALYPVVVRLSADNERKTQEVLDSQAALIDGLKRSERELEEKVSRRTGELQREQTHTKQLLHNMLPVEIAEELSATGSVRPARHESVTMLFTDFSGFTQVASTMPADRIVAELNEIFAKFDDLCDELGIEKIKTIGDAYMAAAGLPKPCSDHAQRCVTAGLRMIEFVEQRNQNSAFKWSLRVGIHSGPVVAGVVGKRKYAFDIWGDTVNIASRIENAGEEGRVNISAYTYDLVRKDFDCEYRGKVGAKGKGDIDMYFVKGRKHQGQLSAEPSAG